jgi:hypothetical protein
VVPVATENRYGNRRLECVHFARRFVILIWKRPRATVLDLVLELERIPKGREEDPPTSGPSM